MHLFGRPRGILGRLGGIIMAYANESCGVWVAELLQIEPSDSVLEVGFGPGVTIQYLSRLAPTGRVAGVDPSLEMVAQARTRNAAAISSGRVNVQVGSAERLPFDDNSFDKVLTINSMQVWSNRAAGLREVYRVMKPNARVALGFTIYSGQRSEGLLETLTAAGFANAKVAEKEKWFCALASKPPSTFNSRV